MMGTFRSATWVVLFALLASVSSGFGITARSLAPSSAFGEMTVCDAQATIARMLFGATASGENAQTVCVLQRALGESTDGDETEGDVLTPPLLAVHVSQRSLDQDHQSTVPVVPVTFLNTILPALDDARGSVPPEIRWAVPPTRDRYLFLLTPHAPPFLA